MSFHSHMPVLFRHCDPAGIIFYPRYFEILNDVVETFFAEVAKYPFSEIHPENGVRTADLQAQFQAPSWHGEMLEIVFSLSRLGGSSATTRFVITCLCKPRMTAQSVLVHVGPNRKSTPWPSHVRVALETLLEES